MDRPNKIDCCLECGIFNECSMACQVATGEVEDCKKGHCRPGFCGKFESKGAITKGVTVDNTDNFDIFVDRVKSLITRWEVFKGENADFPGIAKHCIRGFLSEVNDDFTSKLLKEDADAQDNSGRN